MLPVLQVRTAGGVWRCAWHPAQQGLLACACMQGGACGEPAMPCC